MKTHFADKIGLVSSFACLVHCLIWPVLAGLLSFTGLSLFGVDLDWAFAVLALITAFFSIFLGKHRHRKTRSIVFLSIGILVLWATLLVPFLHINATVHVVLMTFGGVMVFMGHFWALRQNHTHIHDAVCRHTEEEKRP